VSDYFDTGFTVRVPSWHRKENLLTEWPGSWDEARGPSGLMWEPMVQPVWNVVGGQAAVDKYNAARHAATQPGSTVMPADALALAPRIEQVPGQQRIVRDDTLATLGVTTPQHHPITHAEMGEVLEALLQQTNVKYDTAGSVRGGKTVWALAYLDEPIVLKGDTTVTLPYVPLINHHDGNGALTAMSTSVRVVCANTVSMAETQGNALGTSFKFRHTRNWRDKIDDAREVITGVRRDFAAYVELAEVLGSVRVTEEQTSRFIAAFIPTHPDALISDRVMRNVEEARAAIRTILASPTSEGIGGTALGLVQAGVEYADHYRKFRTVDSHLSRQVLRAEPLKTRALKIVKEVANI
jgi:phage/plasmid-like protein (TIGR03299 family)